MMSLVLALAMTVTAAPDGAPASERVELVGKVREVGGGVRGEAQALLVLEDKRDYVLHGATEGEDEELRRLAGVRVKILGVAPDPLLPRGNHVRVEHYEILDVGGNAKPRVGRLAELQLDGKPRLLFVGDDGRADVLPASWSKKMSKHAGAKVWMIGRSADPKAELVPARFGILRPGPKSDPDAPIPTDVNETP